MQCTRRLLFLLLLEEAVCVERRGAKLSPADRVKTERGNEGHKKGGNGRQRLLSASSRTHAGVEMGRDINARSEVGLKFNFIWIFSMPRVPSDS